MAYNDINSNVISSRKMNCGGGITGGMCSDSPDCGCADGGCGCKKGGDGMDDKINIILNLDSNNRMSSDKSSYSAYSPLSYRENGQVVPPSNNTNNTFVGSGGNMPTPVATPMPTNRISILDKLFGGLKKTQVVNQAVPIDVQNNQCVRKWYPAFL